MTTPGPFEPPANVENRPKSGIFYYHPQAIFLHTVLFTPVVGFAMAATNAWRAGRMRSVVTLLALGVVLGGPLALLILTQGHSQSGFVVNSLVGIVLMTNQQKLVRGLPDPQRVSWALPFALGFVFVMILASTTTFIYIATGYPPGGP